MSKKNNDNDGFGILVKILIGIVVAIGLFYLFLLFTRWITIFKHNLHTF